MRAEFEPLSGVVRIFEDGKFYGDKYTWSATCRFIDKTTIEFLGILKAPTTSEWRSIVQKMKDIGVKKIVYKRYKDKKLITKELNLDG